MPSPDDHSLLHNEVLDVLIVEDDPAAARITREAFRIAGLHHGVQSFPDGEEALEFLQHKGRYSSAPHPDLICLDLHLPRKSGLQVLAELKSDPKLRLTPVIVMSGSHDPAEIREAYELHANCFVRKPDDLDQLIRFVQVCFQFWGAFVSLPTDPTLAAHAAEHR